MKKVLSLVLALAMVLGSFSFVSAASYDDVEGTVYSDAVDRLSLLDILTGYPDGSFKPEETITRAEFAAVAIRAKGLENAANASAGLATGFTDVGAEHWASGYVGTAGKLGIVNGVGNGQFAPAAPVKYEEAITMIVRALGYEASAQTKGGYPYGYLIVANEIGLLDDVRGTQGAPASRGIVAQIADNALEIPMMIQVGFGADAKWVISGSNEHGDNAVEITLLTELGLEVFKGDLVDFDADDKEITLVKEKADLTLEVAEGFDFEENFGLKLTVWYNDDDLVVAHKAHNEALFDAIEVTKDEEQIKLVDANKKYDVDEDALIYINGEEEDVEDLEKDMTFDYAKVVLKDGDVIFMNAYNWDDYVVVEEVKDEEIFGYGEELDAEDFVIVKDGKTIGLEDLEEGDILFYNSKAEYAEVFNNTVEGEIEEIFIGEFEVDGKSFDYYNEDLEIDVKYIDEDGDIADFDEKVAEQMEDEGEVAVFMDRYGNAVFVTGDLGAVQTNTTGVILYEAADGYTDTRNREYLELKVVNAEGKAVTYDVRLDDLDEVEVDGTEYEIDDITTNVASNSFSTITVNPSTDNVTVNLAASAIAGMVVEITVDEDGDVVGLGFFTATNVTGFVSLDGVESGDSYIKTYRTNSSLPVFIIDTAGAWDDEDVEVTTYGELEKDVDLKTGSVYHDGSKTLYLVVTDSDMQKTSTKTGVITQVRKNTDGKITRIRALVDGSEVTYNAEDPINVGTWAAGNAAKLVVIDANSRLKAINPATDADFVVDDNFDVITRDRKITDGSTTWRLVDSGYIYDISKTSDIESMSLSELRNVKAGTDIKVIYDGTSTTYIKYVLVGAEPSDGGAPTEEGVVTYIIDGILEVTVPNDTDSFVVRIGTTVKAVVDGEVEFDNLEEGNVYTAELLNLNDLTKVLASTNFIAQ